MQITIDDVHKRRNASRYSTEAAVACRPFTSSGLAYTTEAVMRNFSKAGTYIESAHAFKIGTVIQLRMVQYPSTLGALDWDDQPRSICLAAIKWRRQLDDENDGPYGFGLKYLD